MVLGLLPLPFRGRRDGRRCLMMVSLPAYLLPGAGGDSALPLLDDSFGFSPHWSLSLPSHPKRLGGWWTWWADSIILEKLVPFVTMPILEGLTFPLPHGPGRPVR